MALCAHALSEFGVAYVSYNTLPGGHLRDIVRNILKAHVPEERPAAQQLAAARELLDVLRSGLGLRRAALHARLAGRRGCARTRTRCSSTTRARRTTGGCTSTSSSPAQGGTDWRTSPRRSSARCRSAGCRRRCATACSQIDDRVPPRAGCSSRSERRFRQTLLCRADRRPEFPSRSPSASPGWRCPARCARPPTRRVGRVTFLGPGTAHGSGLSDHPLRRAHAAGGRRELAGAASDRRSGGEGSGELPADPGHPPALLNATNLVRLHADPPMVSTVPPERAPASARSPASRRRRARW